MKTIKPFCIILILILIILSFNTTCDPRSEIIKKDITAFCFGATKYDGTYDKSNYPNNSSALDSLEHVKFNKLYLMLNAKQGYSTENFFYGECSSECIINCGFFNLFIKKTHASSYPSIFPNGNIENISVFSNNDYDSIHKAGDILNDIILISYSNNMSDPSSPIALNDFLKDKPECKFVLFYFFTAPPCEADIQMFTLQYREVDGTYCEMNFKPIIVEP